jgi:trehalose 6-phosphate synthase
MSNAGPALKRASGPDDLAPALEAALPGRQFIVVSNREPFEHYFDDATEEVDVRRPAGGLTSALDPLMQAVGGTWIAWGSGDRDAEVVDERSCVMVPPEDPRYTLHRIWLSKQDIHLYYAGYANQCLWPLCHLRPSLTRFRARYWERYLHVNRRFADAALEDIRRGDRPAAVWFQDYHLAIAPAIVREAAPHVALSHFWHIPFPPVELFRIATNGADLLRGLLANDVMGFHLPLFGDNFLRSVEVVLGQEVDWKNRAVRLPTHTCYVRSFPISIDIDAFRTAVRADDSDARVQRLRDRYAGGDIQLGVGVDRVDYSKGLEEKMHALELLWENYPETRGQLTYVQVAVPSRTGIEAYDWLNQRLEQLVWSINDRFGTEDWRPVHLITEPLSAERLALLYRAADLGIISSLQDGMNLVAKEFVASQRSDSRGVLILSKFAGAAEELEGAVEVNPFDPEAFARAIRDALQMPESERRERYAQLKESMRTIYDWMVEVFEIWGAAARGDTAAMSQADAWKRSR